MALTIILCEGPGAAIQETNRIHTKIQSARIYAVERITEIMKVKTRTLHPSRPPLHQCHFEERVGTDYQEQD